MMICEGDNKTIIAKDIANNIGYVSKRLQF